MAFVKFQVRGSGQWLNIYGNKAPSGTKACQGNTPKSDNFLWKIIDQGAGWSLIQVKDTDEYLNIPGAIPGPGSSNGTVACQNPLPNPNAAPPDNFLWQIEAPDSNGWSLIKVKSSGQYLNVLNNTMGNGDPVCQGNTPNTPNFFWMQSPAKDPKNITVTMNIDCASIQTNLPNGGPLSEDLANRYLSLEDDNRGVRENGNQSSFKSILNPGSQVTWKPQKNGSGNLKVAITDVSKDNGTTGNVLINVERKNDNVQADVIWTAIRPDSGADNKSYTITFTLQNGNGPAIAYTFDPKIRIDPNS